MESTVEIGQAIIGSSFIVFALLVILIIIAGIYRNKIYHENRAHQIELQRKEAELKRTFETKQNGGNVSFSVICNRKKIQIKSKDVLFVKSMGNYIEIHTEEAKHITREKLSNFLNIVPDPEEFIQIRRSFIIRIDKVEGKGNSELIIQGNTVKVGDTYKSALQKIRL